MSGQIAENFENFGLTTSLLLQGIWTDLGSAFGVGADETTLAQPSFDDQERIWLSIGSVTLGARGAGIRRSFPGAAQASKGVWLQWYQPTLPVTANRQWLWVLRDGTNAPVATLILNTDGRISVANSSGTVVATTTNAVVVAGSIQRLQAEITLHATLGAVEIRMNGVATPVLAATGLVLPGTTTQFFIGNNDAASGTHPLWYVKACASYSLSGTYNSSFPAISGIGTEAIDADTADAGWTPRPRQIIDEGVLIVPGSASVLDCGVDADYNLGNGDFTLETFYRPVSPVTGANFATLLGLWSASTAKRSYRLVQYGPSSNNGQLRFEISTDGTTVTPILALTYVFQVGYIYDIAVVRESGQTRIYINGVQVGLDQADANTYLNVGATAKFTVGGEMSGVGSTVLANSSVNAIFDEIRITPGVARYDSNYTPTTVPYPRSAPSDPDFSDVVLLAGFDEAVVDESSAAQTLTVRGSSARLVPADAPPEYLTLNPAAPLDDRYLEAALVSATGILTVEAQPGNTQTVTLGAKTYTFNTVLGGANSILIGADVTASLNNLVNAINGGPGEGTTYGTGTTANATATASLAPTEDQVVAVAITPGTGGNSIVSTETLASGAWTGATLGGGAAIPGNSRFGITTPSPTVTGVRWLEMRNRMYVDAGSGSVQPSFQVSGDNAAGAVHALSTTPTYYTDIFEEDPDTAAGLTPTSLVNGSILLARTA